MTYNFQGVSQESITLLEMNRFNNNKPFYEEHKKEINEGVRQQLGALTLDLAEDLYALDENMLVSPKKVSRIRRDTRFTKDKTLYRANVWVIWHRALEEGDMAPGLWCEISPRSVDNGIGFWRASPSFMAFFRSDLRENATPFLEAFVPLIEAGYQVLGECYKRPKPGTEELPEALQKIYNLKELYFIYTEPGVARAATPAFVDDMKQQIQLMKGMYRYLDGLYARFKALQG
ncbi:MAG: DUF2461 domain-containing protein [Ruminococcaceae bacterium]|nr:DUF2461 domain-containing protein [Oscillospiraceae bacterium]